MHYIIQKLDSLVRSNNKRFQRLGREFFWIILGQVIALLGALVGVRLLTQALPPNVYGELALGMTVTTLTQQIVLVPLSGAALRFFAVAQETGQLFNYLENVRKLSVRATVLLISMLAIICIGLLLTNHGAWLGLVLIAFVFSLLSGYNLILGGIQNAARQRAVVALHDGVGMWLRFLFAVWAVSIFGRSSIIAMSGYALASGMVLCSQFLFFRKGIGSLIDKKAANSISVTRKWDKEMISYALPFSLTGIFVWMQSSSDRWVLQLFTSSSVVGYYAVLYQIGFYPINMLSSLINQLVSPIFFNRSGDATNLGRLNNTRRLNYYLLIGTLILTVVASIAAVVFHKNIFYLLVAKEYRGVSLLLPYMVLSGGLVAAVQWASMFLMNSMETGKLLVPRLIGSVLGVVFNYLGAYFFGLPGVVFATLIFLTIYLLWLLQLSRRGNGWSKKEPFYASL